MFSVERALVWAEGFESLEKAGGGYCYVVFNYKMMKWTGGGWTGGWAGLGWAGLSLAGLGLTLLSTHSACIWSTCIRIYTRIVLGVGAYAYLGMHSMFEN